MFHGRHHELITQPDTVFFQLLDNIRLAHMVIQLKKRFQHLKPFIEAVYSLFLKQADELFFFLFMGIDHHSYYPVKIRH